jgi:hypothetical protein
LLILGLSGCDGDTTGEAASGPGQEMAAAASTAQELDWDTLIPEDWQPDTLLDQYNVDSLGDEDPRPQELMDKLKKLWADAPVVPELDGRLVRLPGFLVPLDAEAERISEFLLVPYYGACIHVPPPPANQTVSVKLPPEQAFAADVFDTVWVTGTLRVTPTNSDLADAGYRIDATAVAPYEGTIEPL